jgi:hypothetical protein
MDQSSPNSSLSFLLHCFNAFRAFLRVHVLISRIDLKHTLAWRRLFLLATRRFVLLIPDQGVISFVVAIVPEERGATHVGGVCTYLVLLRVLDLSGWFPFRENYKGSIGIFMPTGSRRSVI